jgi:hypothetical protein
VLYTLKIVTIQRIKQKIAKKRLTGFYVILPTFQCVHNSGLLIG